MISDRRLAIFGARPGSLGEAVNEGAAGLGWETLTFGLDDEDVHYNAIDDRDNWKPFFHDWNPTDVFITTGTNMPGGINSLQYQWSDAMRRSWVVNVMGPLDVLRQAVIQPTVRSVSIVSSNSAQVARRGSTAYCATKAALSMAIRCAARDLGGTPLVYGYEFGLLAGTPMTQVSQAAFPGVPLTRMVGAPDGLDVREAAAAVCRNLAAPWHGLNGALLRLDAGEQ